MTSGMDTTTKETRACLFDRRRGYCNCLETNSLPVRDAQRLAGGETP